MSANRIESCRFRWFAFTHSTLIRTARITGSVFLIIAAALILSWWLTLHQIPRLITQAMLSVASSKEGVIGRQLVLLRDKVMVLPQPGQTLGEDLAHLGPEDLLVILALHRRGPP